MICQQVGQLFRRWFLQHLLQHVGRTSVADEHSMMAGYRGVEPQAIAHHVGIGNIANTLSSPDIDVATDNHRGQTPWRLFHHALVEWQLQVKQRLRQALTTFPAEHGDGGQHLTTDSIRRQTLALSAGMNDDARLAFQPVAGLLEEPGGSPT